MYTVRNWSLLALLAVSSCYASLQRIVQRDDAAVEVAIESGSFFDLGDGRYTVHPMGTGKVLRGRFCLQKASSYAAHTSTSIRTIADADSKVAMHECDGHQHRTWTMPSINNCATTFMVKNTDTTSGNTIIRCLQSQSSMGADVSLATCDSSNQNQQWTLLGTGHLKNSNGLCLTALDRYTVQLQTCQQLLEAQHGTLSMRGYTL